MGDERRRRGCKINACADKHAETYSNPDADAYSYAHPDADAYSYAHPDADAYVETYDTAVAVRTW